MPIVLDGNVRDREEPLNSPADVVERQHRSIFTQYERAEVAPIFVLLIAYAEMNHRP